MSNRIRAAAAPATLRFTGPAAQIALAAEEGSEEKRRPRFKMVAYTGQPIWLANFWAPVIVDLAGLRLGRKSRPVLRDHDPGRIVGHTDSLSQDGRELVAEGLISGSNAHAAEVVESSREGFPWQASIGATAEKLVRVAEGKTVTVNGREWTGPLIVARKATLREISFVAQGADDDTEATVAATAARQRTEGQTMDFQAWLRANGFELDHVTDAQRPALEAAWRADQARQAAAGEEPEGGGTGTPVAASGGAGPEEDELEDDGDDAAENPLARQRADMAADVRRVAQIRATCGRYAQQVPDERRTEIEAQAIAQGWDNDRAELHLLRAARPAAPAVHSRGREQDCSREALQGAMVLRCGGRLDHPAWQSPQALALSIPAHLRRRLNDDGRQQAMELAHRYSDLSLVDLCREAVRLDGRSVPSGRSEAIQAAFSGATLTNIFTTSVNAILLAAYMEASDTTLGWTQEREVADFKTNERPRMTTGPNLAKLPRGGEADHATRSDTAESYKIARYARQWVVDEQDVIDDSLNALQDIPAQFGAAARRLRPDLVYAILLDNAALADAVALFHATHANLLTTAALTATTLKAAIAALELQRENSVALNLRATHLIVPSDLKHTAANLINSTELVLAGTAGSVTEKGNSNTIAAIETIGLVADSRLSNGVVDPATGDTESGSTSTWYLASSQAHTIEVGYRRGTGRAPQVRSGQLEKGQFGVWFDVNMDIGAKAMDHKGLVKNTA